MSEEKPIEVHVDLGGVMERLNRLERMLTGSPDAGKGEVTASRDNPRHRIVEALKAGSLREQWEPPISLPDKPTASIATFIQRSGEIRGQRGDVVSIPYVRSFEMDLLTNVGDTLTPKTGLYGTAQTTLKEAAATTNIPYADVEKLSEELLEELEARFSRAALRAIDRHILDTLIGDANVPELNKSTANVNFDVDWIQEALGQVAAQGKDLTPQDFILVISPKMYVDLYKDIASSQALVYARPDVVREGLVAEFMGVKILISSYLPEHDSTDHKLSAYLIHRNSLVFAPKRELLIETQRDTAARMIKLTGSYTFGIAVIDNKAICEIKTPATL